VLPWPKDFNGLGYVLAGSGTAGTEGAPVRTGQLALFDDGDTVTFTAGDQPLDVLLLGGRPIREPVVTHGPFVMNTKAEIIEALEDFNAGRLGVVPEGAIQPYRGR
jgi:redox-sensitive bicupin YhaK (pirin superfamily)